MDADLNNIPPAIFLLITEVAMKSPDFGDALANLKKLLPELQTQSRVHQEKSITPPLDGGKPTDLNIFADGAINLFDERVGCADFRCRIEASKRIVRSLGLLGDSVWITDYLTEQFVESDKLDDVRLQKILEDMLILAELFPLIVGGVIKFRSPWRAVCAGCQVTFENQVHRMTDELLAQYSSEFRVEEGSFGFSLHTGTIYTPPMILRVLPSRWLGAHRTPRPDEVMRQVLHSAIRSVLWSSGEAAAGNGVVFSNSNFGMIALARQEGHVRSRQDVRVFDERRNISLPWVSELNAVQILQLRAEASKALPAFRELLSRHLSFTEINKDNEVDLVGELRTQAVDVRNELESTKKHAAKYWKTAYATLGLGISAYGLGSGQVGTSIAGLLPILQLLIQHETGTGHQLEKAHRRPGFVLVKASDLLQHTH